MSRAEKFISDCTRHCNNAIYDPYDTGEQMKYLWKYAEQNNYDGRILTSLYNDLKKLKDM